MMKNGHNRQENAIYFLDENLIGANTDESQRKKEV
jgi:hypothetical protein